MQIDHHFSFHRDLAGRLSRFACAWPGARSDLLPQDIERTGRAADLRACSNVHPELRGHPMNKGTVKWYNDQKGYGFIQPAGGSKDVFVHGTASRTIRLARAERGAEGHLRAADGPAHRQDLRGESESSRNGSVSVPRRKLGANTHTFGPPACMSGLFLP